MAAESAGDTMVKLLGRRKAFKSKLTRIERTVLALNDETSRAYLQVQLEFEENIEADILKFEDDMLAAIPADQYDVQAAECGQLIERCLLLKATLKALIDPTLRTTSRDAGVTAQHRIKSHTSVKLPKLETRGGYGDQYDEWTSYRDRFVAANHNSKLDFLGRRARSFAAAGSTTTSMQQDEPYVKKVKYTNDTSSYLVNTAQRCPMCLREHLAFKCKRRLESRSAEHQDFKQTATLCFNCLRPGHSACQCDAVGCTRCGKKHNTLFHVQENAAMKINPMNSSNMA